MAFSFNSASREAFEPAFDGFGLGPSCSLFLEQRGDDNSSTRIRHDDILQRLRQVIEELPADSLQISEICALLKVSNRFCIPYARNILGWDQNDI